MRSLKLFIVVMIGSVTMAIHAEMSTVPRSNHTASKPPITLFAHGILDTGAHQIGNYKKSSANRRYILDKPYAYFNFDDACEPHYGIKLCKFWHCSFGQANDNARLLRAYNELTKKFPTNPIVLAGVSRGASVIWSFVAMHKPRQVTALILESPFDHIQTSLQAAARHVPALINCGLTRGLAEWILQHIAFKYKVDALQPIDRVNDLPLTMPILIICSLEDKLVPAKSSYALYQALRARGHEHVYIVVLPKGKHAKLLHGEWGQQYESVVHAFYKKYGLPYDTDKAIQGTPLLALCQPDGELLATV